MAKCCYNNKTSGFFIPNSAIINGIQLHNVEPHYQDLINYILIKKVVKDKKKKKLLEEQIDIHCLKYFCSFCLKNYYDITLSEA